MKRLVVFLFIVVSIPCSQAQQELSLHFLQNIGQSSFTNPAFISSGKKEIYLPSIYYNLHTPDFNVNDLFKANINGIRNLNLLAKTTLGIRNRVTTDINASTFGYAFTLNSKWRLSITHAYNVHINADVDGVLIKSLANDYSKSIGKTIPFEAYINGLIYHQLAFGGSYQYRENIRLGARVKIIKGISSFFTRKGQSDVTIDGFNYASSFNNNISVLGYSLESLGELSTLKGLLKQSLKPKNLGIGLDIGAVYSKEKWQFSASIIDALSIINWRKNGKDYNGSGFHRFSGINTNISIFQGTQSYSFNVEDTLKSILGLKILKDARYVQKLPIKIYMSALYNLNNKWQLGALFYDERGGNFPSTTAFMLNTSYKMFENVTFGGSWSIRNKRFDNFGLHATGYYKNIQIYASTDNIFTVFNPYSHKNANGRLGINILLL